MSNQLTPHFSLDEFVASARARADGIDNSLPPELLSEALRTLTMLEGIRAKLSQLRGADVPIIITSGYRSAALNQAIRSVGRSDHPLARAVDWCAPSFGTPTQICRTLAPLVSLLGIGQLINEYPDRRDVRTGALSGWVHTGTTVPAEVKNRVITITAGGPMLGIQEG